MSVEISIIVPVYNTEKYIKNCIKSILNQKFKNFELILVDDGSKDKSIEICKEYIKNKKVKLIQKSNGGVSSARNIGLKYAKGKYIMFCDSDDTVHTLWGNELYLAIQNFDIAISGYSKINKFNKKENRQDILLSTDEYTNNKNNLLYLYNKELLNSNCTMIYKKEIIEKNKISFNENLNYGEDTLFNLEYLQNIEQNKIIYINKSLYNYMKKGEETLTTKYIPNKHEIIKEQYKKLEEVLKLNELILKNPKNPDVKEFYTILLSSVHEILKNTFHKNSKKNLREKINLNNEIINSEEFIRYMNYGDLSSYNKIYIKLLKLKKYILIYLFNQLWYLKKLIIN